MKWTDVLDVMVLFCLFGAVILHAQQYISDLWITIIAAPCMIYIMILSDVIRKRSRRSNNLKGRRDSLEKVNK